MLGRLPANWFLNGRTITDGAAALITPHWSLNHNVIQGLYGEIAPTPHSLRSHTNHSAFAYREYVVIDLELAFTLDEDVDLFVELMLVVKRHGSFRREFV